MWADIMSGGLLGIEVVHLEEFISRCEQQLTFVFIRYNTVGVASLSIYGLDLFDFNTEKIAIHNVGPHITKTNALVHLENMGKISVCDYTSGKICIMH